MLGVWAGQTILLPSKETQRSSGYTSTHLETESESDLPTVHANGKKRKVESR